MNVDLLVYFVYSKKYSQKVGLQTGHSCRHLFSGLCQRSPTISYISQEQITDIGGTVELRCAVQYAENYPVLWMRINRNRNNDPLPISTGSTLIIKDSRFSLRHDIASSTYTLQVGHYFKKYINFVQLY